MSQATSQQRNNRIVSIRTKAYDLILQEVERQRRTGVHRPSLRSILSDLIESHLSPSTAVPAQQAGPHGEPAPVRLTLMPPLDLPPLT